jgi:hypothetical protein
MRALNPTPSNLRARASSLAALARCAWTIAAATLALLSTACAGNRRDSGGASTLAPDPRVLSPGEAVARETRPASAQGQPANWSSHRIDACVGRAIVTPVRRGAWNVRPFRVLLDDGAALRARLFEVTLDAAPPDAPTPGDAPQRRMARWLAPPARWRFTERSEDDARDRASQGAVIAAMIEPPLATTGTGLWVGSVREQVQWLPSSETLALIDPALDARAGVWSPTLPASASRPPWLLALLGAHGGDPLSRWRVRLALDGLRPQVAGAADAGERFVALAFEDAVAEALAEQQEHRWRNALARLHRIDAQLQRHLRARLAPMVEVREGITVPAWSAVGGEEEQLLAELLDPARPATKVEEAARAWLAAQPQGTAWVLDDGGVLVQAAHARANSIPISPTTPPHPVRRALASIGLANLSPVEASAWIAGEGQTATPDLRAIAPCASVVLAASTTPPDDADRDDDGAWMPASTVARDASPAGAPIGVHIGAWQRTITPLPSPNIARPPGVPMGPWLPDLDVDAWLAGDEPAPDAQWQAAALLHRPVASDATTAEHKRWELFVELRQPPRSPRADDDAIEIYAGEPGNPIAAWRITRAGVATDLLARSREAREELGIAPATPTIERLDDRWTLRVHLPPGAIEGDALLRLGLTRIDPRGVRSSWPRALTPWQDEPGRGVIDTSQW